MNATAPQDRLSLVKKFSYGLPAFALAMVDIPIYTHIPKFFTDVIGVPIVWVGAILMTVRVLDAFSDPLMGVLSDRVHTRMGRRRPFILVGSLDLAAAVFLLFVPPASPASRHFSGLAYPSSPFSFSGRSSRCLTKHWGRR